MNETAWQYAPAIITGLATLVTAMATLISSIKGYRMGLRNSEAISSLHDCMDEKHAENRADIADMKETLKENNNG